MLYNFLESSYFCNSTIKLDSNPLGLGFNPCNLYKNDINKFSVRIFQWSGANPAHHPRYWFLGFLLCLKLIPRNPILRFILFFCSSWFCYVSFDINTACIKVEHFFENPISQYCMYKGNGELDIFMFMLETVILRVDIPWKMVKLHNISKKRN